jgi:hypothetical protein
MSNEMLEATSLLILFIEAGVAAWALTRGDPTAVVILNLIGAAGLLIAVAPSLVAFRTINEDIVPFLFGVAAFELVISATCALWLVDRRLTWLAWLVWGEFAGHVALSIGVVYFIFTFKITRLI